jgi:hypothetical protein
MGSLKPGATYIYERAKGVTYAREFGATERRAIGWDYSVGEAAIEEMWRDIRFQAHTNPTLQKALDRAIMIYKLSKDKIRE